MKRINLKKLRAKLAVSEIVGTILLLGIATSCFSIIYFNVLSNPAPNPSPIVEISGMIEENQLILMHRGGEPLDLDTDFVLNLGGKSLPFKVGDFLDSESKEDGVWSLGEKIIYPIDYDFDYSEYPNLEVNIIDDFSSSVVMKGITKIYPTCDLGVSLTVDDLYPKENEYIIFTLTVTNFWNINASGAMVEFLLPEGLTFVDYNSSQGSYNSSIGIWNLSSLNIDSFATLNITAKVEELGFYETTQFVILLDGSGSIDSTSWKLACNGLINAFNNKSVFPRDGSIELTVIQFGVDNVCARIEIGPLLVDETSINSIISKITTLKSSQGVGRTPIAAGFYLGSDKLENSTNFGKFNSDNRQIIILVTDGNANVISDPMSYCGTKSNETLGKSSAFSGRNYLINNLKMTEERDEIDVIAVGSSIDEKFLCDNIAWPQPCYDGTPPPEDDIGWPPKGAGWYRNVKNWQEFADSIDDFFGVLFHSIPIKVVIKSTSYLDPKIANDESIIILKPMPN